MENTTLKIAKQSARHSQAVCLCSNTSNASVSKLQYHQDADCYIASDGYVKVDRHLKEYRRMRQSLSLAKEVQQNLLPKTRPGFKGLDIAAKSIDCDETGGDYFDYHDLGDGDHQKLGVTIGDVPGHGIAAALLMATVRAGLRQRVSLGGSLKDIVSDVNRQLVSDVEASGQFIGLFYLVLDPSERSIKWVRAGHAPAIVYDPDTDTFDELHRFQQEAELEDDITLVVIKIEN